MPRTTTTFHRMGGKNRRGLAVARVPAGFDDHAFYGLAKRLTQPDEWPDLELELDDGILTDFPPSVVLRRLVSPALREVLESFDNPHALWLPVRLTRRDEQFQYFVPHFVPDLDVLHEKGCKYYQGRLTTPCISISKAGLIPYFCLDPLAATLMVRSDVQKAIRASGCVGVEFERVACT